MDLSFDHSQNLSMLFLSIRRRAVGSCLVDDKTEGWMGLVIAMLY